MMYKLSSTYNEIEKCAHKKSRNSDCLISKFMAVIFFGLSYPLYIKVGFNFNRIRLRIFILIINLVFRGCDSVAGKVKTTTASSTRSSLKFSLRSATRAAHNKKVVIKEAMAKEMVNNNNNNNNNNTSIATTTTTTATSKVVLHTVEEKVSFFSLIFTLIL